MSGYSEAYKDQLHEQFLRQWEPDGGWPAYYDATHKWLGARARKAETELKEFKQAIAVIKKVEDGNSYNY